tara:strand:- start:946 stop:1992 length:1047 start_codon:yes stop_codon:yes gene_type:complete
MQKNIKLTQFSHGAGCGCKISPDSLSSLLESKLVEPPQGNLLVGNQHRDDAAVYDLSDGRAVISTTDFFMPIVDDPFCFGRIAATNALSDIYAMGGTPTMAIAIFGWPIDKLPLSAGQRVIEGGRKTCHDAGIHLAGGHSIDSPEPIFGLAATGTVPLANLKKNNTARVGDALFLTKPLGVGILATAGKRGILSPEHAKLAEISMLKLNKVGIGLAAHPGVTAMTDVTGFGLLGHLLEVCRGSNVSAKVCRSLVPVLDKCIYDYCDNGAVPGGSERNWESCKDDIINSNLYDEKIFCDPQTSGGLLVTVRPEKQAIVEKILKTHDCFYSSIGSIIPRKIDQPQIHISA